MFNALLQPAADMEWVGRLFRQGLALIYGAAFVSLALQIDGLAGPDGILPLGEALARLRAEEGVWGFFDAPILFWLDSGSAALQGAAWAGALLALLALLGVGPQRLWWLAMFLLYLSLYHAGQVFTGFQWDYLLLEAGFLAIFLDRAPSRLLVFLYHWLLFRLRFLSGVSKLTSGDPSWRDFSALRYYFETQPLPHAGAWWAHQLPDPLLQAGVAFTFFAELVVPFFIFLPRRFRLFAAAVTALMQVLVIATSNHNFFNLLTLLLCLFLLDDRVLDRLRLRRAGASAVSQRLTFARLSAISQRLTFAESAVPRGLTLSAAALLMAVSLVNMLPVLTGRPPPAALQPLAALGPVWGFGNGYHVFPTMQIERQELVLEGSYDGRQWRAYEFRYKPGALNEAPRFAVPHQPRLDWMMWFVPSQAAPVADWINPFIAALGRNSPAVTGLLARNPFAQGAPPRYFRVLAYRYRFTDYGQRARSGDWWQAQYLGEFPDGAPRRP